MLILSMAYNLFWIKKTREIKPYIGTSRTLFWEENLLGVFIIRSIEAREISVVTVENLLSILLRTSISISSAWDWEPPIKGQTTYSSNRYISIKYKDSKSSVFYNKAKEFKIEFRKWEHETDILEHALTNPIKKTGTTK